MQASEGRIERRALQIVVAIASLVPILAGAAGVIRGPGLMGPHGTISADLDAHFRYLSGLLLGIGLAYLLAVPGIEQRRQRFLLLGSIVFLGGIGRLLAIVSAGSASPTTLFALAMELVVTPLLTFWVWRVAR